MNIENRDWVDQISQNIMPFTSDLSILEVGSFIVHGQENLQCRSLYEHTVARYTGLDMRPGPGVDIVGDAKNMEFADNEFDVIINLDMLEHVDWPRDVIRECYRVTKPGGILYLASVFWFHIHDYPSDYWRFTPACFNLLLKDAGYEILDCHWKNGAQDTPILVRAIGRKPQNG